MKSRSKCSLLVATFSLIPFSVLAQQDPSAAEAFQMVSVAGVPTDWTHRHVVFSSPEADSKALSSFQRDPRYWLQRVKRRGLKDANVSDDANAADVAAIELVRRQSEVLEVGRDEDSQDGDANETEERWRGRRRRNRGLLERDWNQAMNTGFNSYSGALYPAKYSFNAANAMPDCTNDYVVFTTGLSGPSTAFNIIAFKNIYLNNAGGSAFCSGANPTLLFAYYVSTGSTPGGVNTSPTLSLDGTQIAFIEAAGSGAIFHVLKWQAASSVPTFPAVTATLHDCAANSAPPCEYSIAYAGIRTATRSSPFVDYSGDTAYVSDNAGNVYAISPVFGGGTPAVKSGWPLNVGSGAPLTAPVYDSVSQRVFVGGATTGTLYYIKTATSCGATPAPCLGGSLSVSSGTITEPPIVDSTTQKVFVFSSAAPTGSGVAGAAVVQTDSSLTLASRIVAGIGGGSVNAIRLGDFNNAYLSSGASASGAALYACGDSRTGVVDAPVLYAFPFTSSPTAGTLNPAALTGSGLSLTVSQLFAGSCSSITENFNQTTGNDRIFVGVSSNCATGEVGGCILSYDITSGFPAGTSLTAPAAHAAEPGGTSGIIVDNVTDQTSGTQLTTDIYFLSAQTGGVGKSCNKYSGGAVSGNCALSLTQRGLQ
jgi:hypothetical protein